jgi:hypothetical protein
MNEDRKADFVYGGIVAGFASVSQAYFSKKGVFIDMNALHLARDYFATLLYGGLGGAIVGGAIEGAYNGFSKVAEKLRKKSGGLERKAKIVAS